MDIHTPPSLSVDLIESASSFLMNKIRDTPIEPSPVISEMMGCPVSLKLEFLQLTGSFKIRGALFYLSKLNEAERKCGIATCSAGNHGLGVAYAAKMMGIPCAVYVPQSIDPVKERKIMKLGATVHKSTFEGYDETLVWAMNEAEKNGQPMMSAFEHTFVMAANGGTIGLEILKQLPSVENIVFPVGGGGLGAGLSYYVSQKKPSVRLIGAQHKESPAFALSLDRGHAVTALPAIETVAGGIEGGIGEGCFEVLKEYCKEVSLVTEKEIYDGVCWMLENHQYLFEPSCAPPLSACLSGKINDVTGETVLVLSGRNVAFETIKRIINT